jgi:hypothetical protein
MKNFLVTFTTTVIALSILNILTRLFGHTTYSTLIGLGVPRSLIILGLNLLPLLLFNEIVLRLLILSTIKPIKFIATEPEQFQHLDREKLDRHTAELEQLGFIQLIDYTIPGTTAMARLFGHPEQSCFAEVGHVKTLPMFCSISSPLEQDWGLVVTDATSRPMLRAISYAFLRQPRKIGKILDQASPSRMFQTLLEWRSTVTSDLSIAPVPHIQAEVYFENEQKKRIKQRNTLAFKSFTWCLLELFWANLNPQTEWLGDYKKYQGNRSR